MTTTTSSSRVLWLATGSFLALIFTVWAGISLAGHTVGSVSRTEHRVVGDVSEVRIDGR